MNGALLGVIVIAGVLVAGQQNEVSFPTADGGTVYGHLYGSGGRGVVLAHGMVFDKESWQSQAERLAAEGYLVLAIDFRGYGRSGGGSDPRALHEDVLAAVRYLADEHGAGVDVIGGSMGGGAAASAAAASEPGVDVIGGSMGGGAAASAAAASEPGEIGRLILLSGVPIGNPERIRAGKVVFIASEGEPMVPRVRDQYERAPEPKRLELLPGDAHAQHIFRTDQGEALIALILEELAGGSDPTPDAPR